MSITCFTSEATLTHIVSAFLVRFEPSVVHTNLILNQYRILTWLCSSQITLASNMACFLEFGSL